MRLIPTLALALGAASFVSAAPTFPLRFDFGAAANEPGSTLVAPSTLYSPQRGFGLADSAGLSVESGRAKGFAKDALVGAKPFFFIVDLPEGNYDITVHLGDPAARANTIVKAETRRLMLESIRTRRGAFASRTFTVNVRTPAIAGGDHVKLKDRERGVWHWDDKLILEFNGSHPAVAGLEIRPNPDALTIYLAGDSTVTDQPGEPWCAWGQMLPRFFPAGVAVANHAESGLSLASFRGSNRLDKILSTLRPGDYVFIQFGHNDQKEKGEGVGAFTTYAKSLRDYVDAVRAKEGRPVLVTPMYRRRFNEKNELYDTLGDYPAAVRKVAQETGAPLIDLHAMSAQVFSALGKDNSKLAFVHFPAGAYGSEKAVADDTHFSPYGGYELARCIVEGIRQNIPELAARLAPGVRDYKPSKPGSPKAFAIPASPPREEVRIPDGDGR
jgi:lysophospholipase L1-like esterase